MATQTALAPTEPAPALTIPVQRTVVELHEEMQRRLEAHLLIARFLPRQGQAAA